MNYLNLLPYEVIIPRSAVPIYWVNFSDKMAGLVDWPHEIQNYFPDRIPVLETMKVYLRGCDADVTIIGGDFVLLFRNEEDFLAFKLKWM